MIQKLSQQITVFLLHKNAIEEHDKSIYTYGMEIIIAGFISIVSVLLISFILRIPLVGIGFLAIFIPLRMYAGGYHANTYLTCNILFVFVFLLSIFLYLNCIALDMIEYSFVFLIIAFIIISFRAPVENSNKTISYKKKKEYRLVSLIFSFALMLISLISFNGLQKLSLLINVTLFMIAILMLVARGEVSYDEKTS